jgi:MtrB/PioB family decaheme-associated outer membrane protein
MTITKHVPYFGRTLVAVSAALAFGPSLAQVPGGSTTNTTYFTPENSVSVGAGFSSGDQKDRTRFGLFNGLRDHDVNGLLDFNYSNKDAASGKWMTIDGRNLGLDNREASFGYRNLGDFKLKVDYGEITRHDPRTINTSLSGSGTTNPTVSLLATPGTGSELNLELKRKALGFDLSKQFGNFQLQVTFKNEDKNGARQWGAGFACDNIPPGRTAYGAAGVCATPFNQTGILMLPEPVNSTIRQLDAKLNYSDGKLNLSGGYYGNFYQNDNGALTPNLVGTVWGNNNGGTTAVWGTAFTNYMASPLALPPDSQAHQLYLSGNYALASHTKLNFKLSYTHATQNEAFAISPLSARTVAFGGTTRSDLGGELNTTKAQLGFASHPMDKLHVHGDVSYESRENKTPVDRYNIQVLSATPTFGTWTNSAMSPKKFDAKLEANYRLPYMMVLTGGIKYEKEDTGAWTPTDVAGGITALRQKTDSTAYRVELAKTMSETFTGRISYETERREGASDWLKPRSLPLTGVFPASGDCAPPAGAGGATSPCIYSATGQIPYTQKDMQRDKWRLMANWNPIERLSLQGFVETGSDDFRGPTTAGLQNTKLNNISLDASYDVSDDWKVNAYVTTGERSLLMGHSTDYDLKLKDKSTTFGMGFSGKPAANFRVGGDLLYLRDTLDYNLMAEPGTNQALLNQTGGLPDVKYNLTQLRLFGAYDFTKQSSVRVDYIYHRTYFNEWTYDGINNGNPFLFSDNTTITAKQTQSVNYIGAMYVYKFR